MLPGRMMQVPLTLTHFLERAAQVFPDVPIVSRKVDGFLERWTYLDLVRRAGRLARALARLGVKPGDRVATLAWNGQRHFEAYFAIPCMGAVLHTLNLRLHPSDLAYVADHAKDSVLLVDASLSAHVGALRAAVPSIRHVIVMADTPGPLPEGTLDYETLIAAEEDGHAFVDLDENGAAALCYTSGTTGRPKGVLYSHRSMVLHSLVSCMAGTMGISDHDTVLPVVPMFHANAWGLPYSSVAAGAAVVLPGHRLDPGSLLALMAGEGVTLAAGVPTIWNGILASLDQEPKKWDLSRIRAMVVGGAAVPEAMIEGYAQRHGLQVVQAWGMTETSPLGSMAVPRKAHQALAPKEQLSIRASQGYPVPFIALRHVGDDGKPAATGAMGELHVRGPWVASSYFGDDDVSKFTEDGWFRTGDVVTLPAGGPMRICDRSKDVIKSGGEWISSVDLENALMGHPAVLEAAVFAGRHPRWDERPIAAVAFKPGQSATQADLRQFLKDRVARYWVPDAFVFMDEIPKGTTGKFLKSQLRKDHGEMLMTKGQGDPDDTPPAKGR